MLNTISRSCRGETDIRTLALVFLVVVVVGYTAVLIHGAMFSSSSDSVQLSIGGYEADGERGVQLNLLSAPDGVDVFYKIGESGVKKSIQPTNQVTLIEGSDFTKGSKIIVIKRKPSGITETVLTIDTGTLLPKAGTK